MIVSMMCRHCHNAKVNRPRGLCWSCYYRQGVREQYAPGCNRGIDDFYKSAPSLPAPTHALPGSPEKVAVLAERARRKQALWHPMDAQCSDKRKFASVERAMAG